MGSQGFSTFFSKIKITTNVVNLRGYFYSDDNTVNYDFVFDLKKSYYYGRELFQPSCFGAVRRKGQRRGSGSDKMIG